MKKLFPVRITRKQLRVPPHCSRFERLLFRLRNVGHDLTEDAQNVRSRRLIHGKLKGRAARMKRVQMAAVPVWDPSEKRVQSVMPAATAPVHTIAGARQQARVHAVRTAVRIQMRRVIRTFAPFLRISEYPLKINYAMKAAHVILSE